MKSAILLLIVLVASALAMPAPDEEHREYSRTKRSFLGGYFYPYGGYGYGFPGYGFAYPTYGYPYGYGGYGLYKGFGHGFYG